jgi:hypothetical protein
LAHLGVQNRAQDCRRQAEVMRGWGRHWPKESVSGAFCSACGIGVGHGVLAAVRPAYFDEARQLGARKVVSLEGDNNDRYLSITLPILWVDRVWRSFPIHSPGWINHYRLNHANRSHGTVCDADVLLLSS